MADTAVFRELAAGLSAQIASVGDDAREAANRAKEAAITARKVEAMTSVVVQRVERLETAVFGSNPPPALPAIPLIKRTTNSEDGVADLTGRLLNLQNEVKLVKQQNTDQLEILNGIKTAVTGVMTHPIARKVALAAAVVALAWLGSMQARIQERMDKVSPSTADGGFFQLP